MSAKERDRLKVLHEVKQRYITQKQAAGELGRSVREETSRVVLSWREIAIALTTCSASAPLGGWSQLGSNLDINLEL
jgi:hypothetical protein